MKGITSILILVSLIGSLLPVYAQKREPDSRLYRTTKDRKDLVKAYREAAAAAAIITEIMQDPEESIPPFIIDEAELIAVFPARSRYGVKFEAGSGLVSVRDQQTGEWGAPIYIKMHGGSIKGIDDEDRHDLVLLGLNLGIAGELLKSKFKLDREVGAQPGPIRKEIEPLPSWTNETGFVAYMRGQERLSGIAIMGSRITADEDLMEEVYGKETFDERLKTFLPASQFVSGRIMIFPETLNKYSRVRGV
jgi:lipid-binding SYLF domain-containing protein